MPRRIGLLVGNGLSIDLRYTFEPLLNDWNTQQPLQWTLPTPDAEDQPFLKSLPRFDNMIREVREGDPEISDFDLIAEVLRRLPADEAALSYEQKLLRVEMRHFLAIAFSHYQRQLDTLDLTEWKWLRYLESVREYIAVAVSFNYDLLLEVLFRACGLEPRRSAIQEESDGIRIMKPHGSIDFGPHEQIFDLPTGYPLRLVVESNDMYLRRLNVSELTEPRLEADIVLPSEYSPYTSFQWVQPDYDWFRTAGSALTEVLVVGLSYWECDRPEIDYLLQCIPRWAEVKVVNPSPDPELVSYMRSRFSKVTLLSSCPKLEFTEKIYRQSSFNARVFSNETVRLTDLIFDTNVITGFKFDNCRILGPAMVVFTGAPTIKGCRFNGSAPALLWEILPERGPSVIGPIQLHDCTFINCDFQGLGVAGTRDFLSTLFRD